MRRLARTGRRTTSACLTSSFRRNAGREIMRQFLKALVTMQQEVSGWLALKGLRPPWCVQLIS